jgi:hypothetical protein
MISQHGSVKLLHESSRTICKCGREILFQAYVRNDKALTSQQSGTGVRVKSHKERPHKLYVNQFACWQK